MNSLILRTGTKILVSLMILFSIFIMLRGHNQPGGGFVGGLIASTAFGLYAVAYGPQAVRNALHFDPRMLSMLGLSFALAAGIIGIIVHGTFMTGTWTKIGGVALGTPVLFDLGVYFVVIGAVMTLILAMEEEE